jgi:hypothetical protein
VSEGKVYVEKMSAKWKADQEVGTRLEAIHNKIKAKEDKLRAAWAMFDAEQQIFKADRMKAYKENQMAERKADQETREAERKANIEKIEPTEHTIAILEQMIESLLARQEEMKAKADTD